MPQSQLVPLLEPDASVRYLLDVHQVRRYHAIPLRRDGPVLEMAMSAPGDLASISELEFLTGHRVRPVPSSPGDIERSIARHYPSQDLPLPARAGSGGAPSPPVVELERALFREAIRRGASDIHIDPGDRSSRVRYRVDGRLIDGFGLPRWLHDRIVARFKVMARLDISERSLPQDGHLSDPAEGFEARLSTLPTYRGEAVVLRLFGDRGEAPSLARIGCGPEVRHQLLAISQRRQGVLLVAGPTGSGKTTTLYAILHELLREPLNIVTIEDPVEYRVEGIRQVQVDERRNRTFQTALRSTLRQDPDVILVGEIRDAETARIAFHAGLTGHLVLSTLHAREAVATLVRLSELGVDRGVIASTLIGVVAQRLPPRSCPGCRAPDDAPEYLADRLGIPTAARSGLSRPRGCIDCGFSGTRGRLPIFEILEPDRHLPGEPLPEGDLELRRLAIGSGFVPMIEAALPLALAGEMTLEEAFRACYFGGSR